MSDEREQAKPNEREQVKSEPDFQLHQAKGEASQVKSETVEPEDTTEDDDFELHVLKPGGIADQLKGQLKE
jgi:hypothetical protein